MRHLASRLLLGIVLVAILSLVFIPLAQAEDYQLLDPTFIGQNQANFGSDFIEYAKIVYQTILLVVVVLSIVMIALGGMEYVASGAAGAKLEGKERIWNAIIGLLIALASFLILYTIDPSLVSFDLDLGTPIEVSSQTNGHQTGNGNAGGGGGSGNGGNGLVDTSWMTQKQPGETNAQAILRNAKEAADTGQRTCSRVACAGSVNDIVKGSTGTYVGGGASSSGLYNAIKNNPNFEQVTTGFEGAQPGDIIVSPSQGGQHGHVGICETVGCTTIISNQSSNTTVTRWATKDKWANRYNNLGIYIFRPIG